MEADALSLIMTGAFSIVIGFLISRIMVKGQMVEILNEEVKKARKEDKRTIDKLKETVNLLTIHRDTAIDDAKYALKERNEALKMLTEELSKKE